MRSVRLWEVSPLMTHRHTPIHHNHVRTTTQKILEYLSEKQEVTNTNHNETG